MSVFTPITQAQLEAFLAPFNLGPLRHFTGISAGSENSNFFVSCAKGEFVLTLVERGDPEQLIFLAKLLSRLEQSGLPVAHLIADQQGQSIGHLLGKAALLQPRLAGQHVEQPDAHHCKEIGHALARMHTLTHADPVEWRSDRGLEWMLTEGNALLGNLDSDAQLLLEQTLNETQHLQPSLLKLPRANLHADLFRDNVLFEGHRLSGLLDFHNACAGPMLYDVAIACNDWCSSPDGRLDPLRSKALLVSYGALRHFSYAEAQLWPLMLRIACLRFWLSRLINQQQTHPHALIKPAQEFAERLRHRQRCDCPLPLAL